MKKFSSFSTPTEFKYLFPLCVLCFPLRKWCQTTKDKHNRRINAHRSLSGKDIIINWSEVDSFIFLCKAFIVPFRQSSVWSVILLPKHLREIAEPRLDNSSFY